MCAIVFNKRKSAIYLVSSVYDILETVTRTLSLVLENLHHQNATDVVVSLSNVLL